MRDDAEMSFHYQFSVSYTWSSFLPSPTGPSTAHRTTGEVSERTTWSSADRALYPARGLYLAVTESSAIGRRGNCLD